MCGFVFSASKLMSEESFKEQFQKTAHRGPDNHQIMRYSDCLWGFHRLSIMDLSDHGNQPFFYSKSALMCNGEIYNYQELNSFLEDDYQFQSGSDCEVLLPLYEKVGIEAMVRMLDAEFAFVLYDAQTKQIIAARDPFGIRGLFYGYEKQSGAISFASEAKSLVGFCEDINPFPPGHYYQNGSFHLYHDIANVQVMVETSEAKILTNIREKLERAVQKRLHADAPVGYLLSGGLDSSLVCAIASRHLEKPIQTFAIGMETDPIDLKYAKEVAEHLGTIHTEVIIKKADVLEALETVIYHLETWDITTIRASIGMFLVCKYIREHTDLKVLLTGEVSDEMFGYKYTDFAPGPAAFQEEAQKRVQELYMYDVLRADRCLAAHSLEARVPFADLDFASYVMQINPWRKMNRYGQGKYLLRKAFAGMDYLPDSILFREKAAFSDAVGHSLVDYLKEYADICYTELDLEEAHIKYPIHTPFTKESLLYRDLFEKFYPHQEHWIKDFWMPNKEWEGCNVNDPSARVLTNYGESGQ